MQLRRSTRAISLGRGRRPSKPSSPPPRLISSNARYSGRIADEIDPRFARHEVDDGLVLRCERFDVSFAVIVRFSEGVLCVFGREQGACLGERDPSSLIRWQCRQ